MSTWVFTVEIRGDGDTAEAAWLDAVAALGADPGDPLTAEKEVADGHED